MICVKCKQNIQDDAVFCSYCGKKQTVVQRKRRVKSRANGTGCAYWDPVHRYWVAQVIEGYRPLPPFDPKNPNNKKQRVPIKKTKSGFKTRDAALAYCSVLNENKEPEKVYTLKEVYDMWEPWYQNRVGSMAGYKAAFNHFSAMHEYSIDSITAGDLQDCMDACPAGKRTHQMMKVLAGLLWGYACDKNIVPKKITENLYTGKGASKKREALTEDEVEIVRQHLDDELYASYVYCLCYLGFRPGEMLELKKDQLHEEIRKKQKILYLIEGKKTEAGRDRIVPIPPQIADIIRKRSEVPDTDLLFPMYRFDRKGNFQGYKQMTDCYFRESVFKPLMNRLGITEGKVPYSARHTYANKLKKAKGDDIDKAALIGHSNYTFTQTNYQSTNIDELNAITKSMK